MSNMHSQHPQGEGKDCLSEDAAFSWAESGPSPQSLPRKLPCSFFLRMGLCCHRPRERPLPGPQLCPLLATEQACAWRAHLKSECEVQRGVSATLLSPTLPACHVWADSLEASRELPDWRHSSIPRCVKCCIDHPCNAWPSFLRCPYWDSETPPRVSLPSTPWMSPRTKGDLLLLGRKGRRWWISETNFSCDPYPTSAAAVGHDLIRCLGRGYLGQLQEQI